MPDIEFMFRSTPDRTHLWAPLVRPPYLDGFGIKPALLHPESRGEVLLRSADPRDSVRIILNLFSVRDDLETLRELERYVDGECLRELTIQVETHLSECSDCSDHDGGGPKCLGGQTIAVIRRLAANKAIERKLLYENAKKLLL